MTTYTQEIITDASDSSLDIRKLSGNGCPNHYSVCTGKEEVPVCGGDGGEGTSTEALVQDFEYEIPANPIFAESTTDIE